MATENLSTNIALASQLRIFLAMLDPRNRVLPVPSGFDERYAIIKHAIMVSNLICPPKETKLRTEWAKT